MYQNLGLGFVLIAIGAFLGFLTLPYIGITISPVIEIFMLLIMTVPFFVAGGIFMRRFYNRMKLEKIPQN